MMWVCRSGKQGKYYHTFLEDERIYLIWDGYRQDYSKFTGIEDFRKVVVEEKHPEARTSISNWTVQLYSFCIGMCVGDYVLIPSKSSHDFILCRITGGYEYDCSANFPHSRKIQITTTAIPKSSFPKSIQYSLGAFRTVFKVKQESGILKIAEQYKLETGTPL